MGFERVVDIAEDGLFLSKQRGFLSVSRDGKELGRVPLDDMSALIVQGRGATLSANLIAALAERNIFGVICGENYQPIAAIWPLSGHHSQGARMRAQITSSLPLKKRIWQALVRAKIEAQAAALALSKIDHEDLVLMSKRVRSGDPANIEAQAARRYWPRLMGADFIRDPKQEGLNALLNYGYAIIRASCSRSIVASGLHPTIGVFHSAARNDFALSDDMMEPFRPFVDLAARSLWHLGHDSLTPASKKILANILCIELRGDAHSSPLSATIQHLSQSLANSLEQSKVELRLPPKPDTGFLQALEDAGG